MGDMVYKFSSSTNSHHDTSGSTGVTSYIITVIPLDGMHIFFINFFAQRPVNLTSTLLCTYVWSIDSMYIALIVNLMWNTQRYRCIDTFVLVL